MNVLIGVSAPELSDRFRRLIDPDIPLSAPERFAPESRAGGPLAWIGVAGLAALLAVLTPPTVRAWLAFAQGQPYGPANLYVGPPLMLVLGYMAMRLIRRIRLGRAQARDQQAGRYRIGMFMEAEALLFHDGSRCTLVPRERVVGVERRAAPGLKHTSGAKATSLHVVFHDDNGQEHARWLPHSRWLETTSTWIRTGKLPPRPAQPTKRTR